MVFDSDGHVTIEMKLVELSLFVWILYCSWEHYIGDEDKKMEKSVLPTCDCFSDLATIGPRWTRWLTSKIIRTVRRRERAYYKRRRNSSN